MINNKAKKQQFKTTIFYINYNKGDEELIDYTILESTSDTNEPLERYPIDSITEQHIKEGLSVAYVTALAHYSGLLLGNFSFDYGMDGNFSGVRKNGKRYASNGFYLDFQLKASCNVEIHDDYIKYNLEAKTYNDLVDENVGFCPTNEHHHAHSFKEIPLSLILNHKAWKHDNDFPNKKLLLYKKVHENEVFTLTIPAKDTFSDYKRRLVNLIDSLSDIENIPKDKIIYDLQAINDTILINERKLAIPKGARDRPMVKNHCLTPQILF